MNVLVEALDKRNERGLVAFRKMQRVGAERLIVHFQPAARAATAIVEIDYLPEAPEYAVMHIRRRAGSIAHRSRPERIGSLAGGINAEPPGIRTQLCKAGIIIMLKPSFADAVRYLLLFTASSNGAAALLNLQ